MPTKTTTKPASSKTSPKTGNKTGNKPASRGAVDKKAKTSKTTSHQARQDLDIEHYRSLLLAERSRLEMERDQIRSHGLDVEGALPEEGESGDEDTADLASAMMDKEIDLSVEDEIEDMLGAIDHALQKIEDGTYGVCDVSGQPIPMSRLELIPWASLTVECQALAEGQ